MAKMTQQEALQEAQRRWGKDAEVCRYFYLPFSHAVYAVGHVEKGTGDTWEAAFADADRKEKESNG